MANPMNDKIYEDILSNEGFLNDQWNKFDTTTKVEILTKAGVDLELEYLNSVGSAEEHEASDETLEDKAIADAYNENEN